MKPATEAPERVMVDYWTKVTDEKGKPVACHVQYTRVGSLTESEAHKRAYEAEEYLDRRARVRRLPG